MGKVSQGDDGNFSFFKSTIFLTLSITTLSSFTENYHLNDWIKSSEHGAHLLSYFGLL